MAVKRGTKPKKVPSPIIEKTTPPVEDRVAIVTEVVEIVENAEEKSNTTDVAPQKNEEAVGGEMSSPEELNVDKTSVSESGETSEPAQAGTPPQGEKRKEVVEELFKTKEPMLMPEISTHRSGPRPLIGWVVAVVTAAVVIGIALLVMSRGLPRFPSMTRKPTPTPTPIATPTPETPKREDLSIQVLNGGGKPGAASKMKDFLETKGYKVDNLGNTEEYTYQKTEILVKVSKSAYLLLLEQDLKEGYDIGTAGATLPDSVNYDAQVIVGKK